MQEIDKLEPAVETVPHIQVHEHGFVRLVDYMGTDDDICDAARVSYGKGTRNVTDNRNLIRYLLRHRHTSPFEMAEIKFHIKLPIFVMRQHIRHRTANVNEYSGRYSEMPDEFYVPDESYIQPQSKTNKQGREGTISDNQKTHIKGVIEASQNSSYGSYKLLLGESKEVEVGWTWPEDYPGMARESARAVLPVSNYTECYWKIDLHNLFHYMGLRRDSHAQREIRDYAEAMWALVKPLYPASCEAFEDYRFQAKTFSRMELEVIKELLHGGFEYDGNGIKLDSLPDLCENRGMSKREKTEFINWISSK